MGEVSKCGALRRGFTAFAITLNELTPEMLANLPPTVGSAAQVEPGLMAPGFSA